MTDLKDLVLREAVLARVAAASKRQALQAACEALAGAAGLSARDVFDAVMLRERLSGTGVGEGVAIPHARIEGLERPVGGFARLEPAQDFEALDRRPCDLVFILLAPAKAGADHLRALARVSRFFRRADLREKLRRARGADELTTLLTQAGPVGGA